MVLNKKTVVLILFLFSKVSASGWVGIGSQEPVQPNWQLLSSNNEKIEITFEMKGYFSKSLSNGKIRISFPTSAPILNEGSPNLPLASKSVIIPEQANMSLSIVESEYTDFQINNIEPSRGNLFRDVISLPIPLR